MRISFEQSLKCGTPIHKEHVLHEQIISQMGNYQEYLKKSVAPLRDPNADPDMPKQRGPTFGNPWKVTLDTSNSSRRSFYLSIHSYQTVTLFSERQKIGTHRCRWHGR